MGLPEKGKGAVGDVYIGELRPYVETAHPEPSRYNNGSLSLPHLEQAFLFAL